MKNLTVSAGISTRPVKDEDVPSWVNREAVPVLTAARDALNSLASVTRSVQTAGGGVYVNLWVSEEFPTEGLWTVSAKAGGISTSGAAQSAAYHIQGCFRSAAGVLAQVGSTSTVSSFESAAAIDAKFVVDGTARTVSVQVRDNATSPMRFTGRIEVLEALAA